MKRPAFMFYPADWRTDQALQACPIAARGVWHEMLCLMHECQPYGHLTVNGAAMPDKVASRLLGTTPKEYKLALRCLENSNVFSRTKDGIIYSRRMVHDEATRNARAIGGYAGKEHGIKGKEYGVQGGRPSGDKKPPLNPPPSFAVAFSSSIPSVRSEQNPGTEDSRTPPPQGFFEKLKTDIPTLAHPPTEPDAEPAPEPPTPAPARRINGHAVKPLAALTKGNWKANQVSIAAVAAQLEFRPQAGETFAQLAERCDREISRRRKEAST